MTEARTLVFEVVHDPELLGTLVRCNGHGLVVDIDLFFSILSGTAFTFQGVSSSTSLSVSAAWK